MIAEYELSRESDERLYVSLNQDGECPMHFHRKIELVYIQSGHKKIFCDDKEFLLEFAKEFSIALFYSFWC